MEPRKWLVRLTGRQPVIVQAKTRIGAKFAARALFGEDIDCYAIAIPWTDPPAEDAREPKRRGRPPGVGINRGSIVLERIV